MSVNTEVKGLVETECAVRRLSDELRRVRTVAIFLARGILRMQRSRQDALVLPPEDCKEHLLNEFPILHGPKAEETVQRLAYLEDISADRAETKHMGKASLRESEGWVPVTVRYPGAQPYTWSRSVLILLDTGGIAISSYFDRQNLEGQWLNLEEGFGTVTHWHELPPVPEEAEQTQILQRIEKRQASSSWKRKARAAKRRRPQRSLEDSLWGEAAAAHAEPTHVEPQETATQLPQSPEVPQPVTTAPPAGDEIKWI